MLPLDQVRSPSLSLCARPHLADLAIASSQSSLVLALVPPSVCAPTQVTSQLEWLQNLQIPPTAPEGLNHKSLRKVSGDRSRLASSQPASSVSLEGFEGHRGDWRDFLQRRISIARPGSGRRAAVTPTGARQPEGGCAHLFTASESCVRVALTSL